MLKTELWDNFVLKLQDKKTLYDADIWHYTSNQGLKGILENNCLWFSDRRFLNDKTECSYVYELIKELLEEGYISDLDNDFIDFLNVITKEFSDSDLDCNKQNKVFLQCYVASFSLQQDDLSLWNYYTKNQQHVGYSIKLNTNKFIKKLIRYTNNKDYSFTNGMVIYSKLIQQDLLLSILNEYNKLYVKKRKNKFVDFDEDVFFFELINLLDFYNLFFKPQEYSIENEYRFVIQDLSVIDYKKNNEKKFRISNDIFIPYIEIKSISPLIEEIMVSPAPNQNLLKNSVTILKDNYGLQNTIVTKSKIPLRY